jgi:hypothetical protein
MTAIVVSLLELASSCFAKTVAVSWEYYPHSVSSFEIWFSTHPKLGLIPILCESIHCQGRLAASVILASRFEILEKLLTCVTICIEFLQGVQSCV